MDDLRLRARTPRRPGLRELVRRDSFAGWLLLLAGAVLVAASLAERKFAGTPGPLVGLLVALAGLALLRFLRPRAGRRGSSQRRTVRRFIALAMLVAALAMVIVPTYLDTLGR